MCMLLCAALLSRSVIVSWCVQLRNAVHTHAGAAAAAFCCAFRRLHLLCCLCRGLSFSCSWGPHSNLLKGLSRKTSETSGSYDAPKDAVPVLNGCFMTWLPCFYHRYVAFWHGVAWSLFQIFFIFIFLDWLTVQLFIMKECFGITCQDDTCVQKWNTSGGSVFCYAVRVSSCVLNRPFSFVCYCKRVKRPYKSNSITRICCYWVPAHEHVP